MLMNFFSPLKRIAGRLSLKSKLFLLLAALSVIPLTLVGYSSQYFMYRSGTEYSSSISQQYVRFVSQDISAYLEDVSNSFDALFTNSDFQKFTETPDDDLVAQANYIINFKPILRNALQMHNEILAVLYLDEQGKVHYESYQKRRNTDYRLENDGFYSRVKTVTRTELSVPHPMNYVMDSNERVISLVRPIYNLRTGKINAWFVIEIREDKFKNLVSGELYRQEGRLLLYQEPYGVIVSEVATDPDLHLDFNHAMAAQQGNSNDLFFTSDEVRYEATYADLPYSGWKLVWMAPLSSITEGVQQSNRATFWIAVVSLAISLIVAFPFMNTVLRPLHLLKRGLQSLGRGSYVPIQAPGNDDFGFLVKSYNRMLDDLQSLEQEVYQSKIKEKERELLQLQAQINPHFLFNTLETIESYAVKNKGEAVGEMVQSVSRMMRYSVRNDGGWAPLKEELSYIRNFLTIHYYRHGLDVNARFDIDPSCLDLPVMKLSVQPFVENAIKYGWSPSMTADQFILIVQVRRDENNLYISVRNTGTEIMPAVADKLAELIESKSRLTDPFFKQHTGISNVYRRFILAYGDSVAFNITTGHEGTEVTLRAPIHQSSELAAG